MQIWKQNMIVSAISLHVLIFALMNNTCVPSLTDTTEWFYDPYTKFCTVIESLTFLKVGQNLYSKIEGFC